MHPAIKDKMFVCDRQYFIDAIKKIEKKIDNPKFAIFSDDLKWVREYIKLEEEFPQYEFIYETGDDTVEEKLRMMSGFKNFIISNSSFSWWAQYLSKRENKIVMAPDMWFPDGRKGTLYMEDWDLVKIKKENDI